jgi:hypothetical protein
MSVHVCTGNHIDVVYDYDSEGKQRFLGIQPWNGQLIPVEDPKALGEVLLKITAECGI